MKILKIRAGNMRDALAEARLRLGEDAAILHTRQFEERAALGLRSRHVVEVLAAGEEARPCGASSSSTEGRSPSVERELSEIKHALEQLLSGTAIARARQHSPEVQRLIDRGVSESVAKAVLSDDTHGREIEHIARRIRCTGGLSCGMGQSRVALIGPTGVGKTTTAAKLAAQFALLQGKKVALVTLDTYRIGAVEQLGTYARILGLPLEVAFSPEDGDALVQHHADKDLVIIDTVGRSQRKPEHIEELGLFLNGVQPTDVHLVVSASADSSARAEAVDVFGRLGATRMILTKLDECSKPGCILDLAVTSLLPYSYITYGQDVPDDIAVAETESLAKLVWEGAP